MRRQRRTRVGILGAGAWGTALGKVLAERGHEVKLWSYEEEVAREINRDRRNRKYLIGVELPPKLEATTDIARAVCDQDFLLLAVPSRYAQEVARRTLSCRDVEQGKTPIGILSKGFVETEGKTLLLVEALEQVLPLSYKNSLVYISGPSHAEEVARGKITGLISASRNGTNAIRYRELLNAGHLVVFSSLDVLGVQICAALKNVIAIAFGMVDALSAFSERFGDNTESLLLAAGLNEIQRLGLAMGATHPETFTSIAGVGDLEVTCRSEYGRNRRFGREVILDHLLARYQNIEGIIEDIPNLGYLPEGVPAARSAFRLSRQYRIDLPICRSVYRVLNREAEPLQEVERVLRQIARQSDNLFSRGSSSSSSLRG